MTAPVVSPNVEAPLQAGEVIGDRYRIDAVLGGGGMAMVYRATHLALGQRVAIKVLASAYVAAAGMAERFLREARAATALRSPHIARVLDVGTLPNGAPFMVMEYLDGKDLETLLASGFRPDTEDAVRYVLHACAALAEVHGVGIVHRDLKPANLFLTRGPDGLPFVKLIDFGIAHAPSAGDLRSKPHLTDPEIVMGTPRYMAPEQMESAAKADARSDIWSLGVVLYELLTGDTPYLADSLVELYNEIHEAPPIPPSQFRPDVPRALDAIILKCLSVSPSARFADVADLAVALVPYGGEAASVRAEDAVRVLEASRLRESEHAIEITESPARGRSRVRRRSSARTLRLRPTGGRTSAAIAAGGLFVLLAAILGFEHHLAGARPAEATTTLTDAPIAAAPPTAEPPAPRAIVIAPVRAAAPANDTSDVPAIAKTAPARPTVRPATSAPSARPRPEPPRTAAHLFEDRK